MSCRLGGLVVVLGHLASDWGQICGALEARSKPSAPAPADDSSVVPSPPGGLLE